MQLESFLEHSAARHADKIALVCGDRRLTYGAIDNSCNQLAHALIAARVERGDRVVIFLDNSVEAVRAVFAILKAGAVFVPVNPTTKPDKLAFLLNNCRAKALIAPAAKAAQLEPLWPLTPDLKSIFWVGDAPAVPVGNGKSSQRFGAEGLPSTPPANKCINIDLAALIYTSGSTGQPKGVMLTHLNMVSAATSITTYLENQPDDIVLNVLPLAFDYGLYQVLMAFQFGGTVVLERSFTYPHAVLATAVRERVTGLPLVPTLVAMLLQMDLSRYDWSALRYITSTAAALPTEHLLRFQAHFPQTRIYSMYGLTECKRVSYLPPDQLQRRPQSIGRGMPNEEVYIVDEQHRRVGPGVVGELVVRGANVMKGYWELPNETAQRLKPGPLPGEMALYTGDLFRMDDEGYLYFVGRKDDMLKSRGEKVSPREVENVLCGHPSVAEAVVLGVPDPILGQAIKGLVVLKQDRPATVKDLKYHCSQHLEDFMVPQLIEFRAGLPRSANGKVDKQALLAGMANQREGGFSNPPVTGGLENPPSKDPVEQPA